MGVTLTKSDELRKMHVVTTQYLFLQTDLRPRLAQIIFHNPFFCIHSSIEVCESLLTPTPNVTDSSTPFVTSYFKSSLRFQSLPYDHEASSTYSPLLCSAATCTGSTLATCPTPDSPCQYQQHYSEGSSTSGTVAIDVLSLPGVLGASKIMFG